MSHKMTKQNNINMPMIKTIIERSALFINYESNSNQILKKDANKCRVWVYLWTKRGLAANVSVLQAPEKIEVY